jgi:hypothetical protein
VASRYKVEQRRIKHRGRSFHFVSYEGQSAHEARKEPATENAWFLVSAGRRWKVMSQQTDLEPDELDRLLTEWLEAHVFAEGEMTPVAEV